MDILFFWGPKFFFTALFVVVGYASLRRKTIPLRLSYWILFLYPIERFIELAGRTVATILSNNALPPDSFTALWTNVQIIPSLQSILFREGVIILIAAIVWFLLSLYASRTKGTKIDQSDVNIFAFGVLVSGWPNFLIFFMLVFVCAVLGILAYRIFAHGKHMLITPFFLIAGIIMIYWGWKLSVVTGLYALR
ncbi:MAG: hypothetical protein WC495_03845 [Patescibacteria group bacterium]|jgi:hypothetical protein